ncbi:hypothetical protein FACS189461_4110 [Spirochaetia bacterium]|nr:hypothetical protein FACS189461_4110 [Spirochaetia bacterium]
MILPVNLNPYARTFQYNALPISALTAACKETELYIINKFIQVYFCDEWVAFYDSEEFNKWSCVDAVEIETNTVKDQDEFMRRIIDSLKEGIYIYCDDINELYIPNRNAYMQCDFKHDILVHGYDDNFLYVLGYCENGKFMTTTVSYDNFKKSLPDYFKPIFFKADQNYKNELDINLNLAGIKDYLLSQGNPGGMPSHDIKAFGIDAFKQVCQLVSNTDYFDYRSWDLLFEHKRLMFDRICLFSRLFNIEEIKAGYQDVLLKTSNVRMLALKCRVLYEKGLDSRIGTKNTIIDLTMSLLESERLVLGELVTVLEKLG